MRARLTCTAVGGRAVAVRAAAALALAWAGAGVSAAAQPPALPELEAAIVGDALPQPLSPEPGDPRRGRAIVVDRQLGLCLLCHSGPFPEERTPGTLATNLAGAGARWTAGQLRLRIADSRRLDPRSLMPAYHRTTGLSQVAAAVSGRPLLSAQQVEDVVAFLLTLRD